MKVLIPVSGKNQDHHALVSGFHNTRALYIYDVESGSYEWIDSQESEFHSGNLSLQLKKLGVNDIICSGLSLLALGIFIDSGFRVFKPSGLTVGQSIRGYLEEQLNPVSSETASEYISCSGSCIAISIRIVNLMK